MLVLPIILLAISALFGLHILLRILNNRKTPKASIALHGLLNVTAITIVAIAVANGAGSLLVAALVVFVLAAMGGLILFYIDNIKKQPPPKVFAILHPLVGVTGLVLLILYVVGT